jgi:tetratricopeptide (TPR) repeat protein
MTQFNLALTTNSRAAFERVSGALDSIEAYQRTKQRTHLEKAERELKAATDTDPTYLAAWYYLGILRDLMGQAADAVPILSRVVGNIEEPEKFYVQYALALAYYHQYRKECLKRADAEIARVLNTKNETLRAAAQALRAQVHAMLEIPIPGTDGDAVRADIKAHQAIVQDMATNALKWANTPPKRIPGATSSKSRDEISAMAYNALGMSGMYQSDFADEAARLSILEAAKCNLEKADEKVPNDWANVCDLASCYMRLGIYKNSSAEFKRSRELLGDVVDNLRPEYGFALYEIGRTYRTEGNFVQAKLYFERALRVPLKYRDVSDVRIQLEIEKAENSSTTFP